MFDQFTPIFQELTQQPAAFFGGFCSGLLQLNLSEDPIKTWLDQQISTPETETNTTSGPQSIEID
ncbi:hypothetical protein PN466_06520 [Roseofilum reptotaenium CS-1145]|uniref:Uncharacterized protein n=1 Tax=Roseofilum reptotaenium AO1-A TaxID=1925591 RepID=A0A1L9QPN8_9CYAN|nr:hypothetical protein [Roseofilum reptotaenium]MDB9516602.1 hypothetical protein [Roseofilum reptotaenium CS-1145]OJJ24648.1 hypothetical protein BI308_15225 [Roseofilum reptotaenium AO1-A]